MMISILRLSRLRFFSLFLLFLLVGLFPLSVYADGGAPQLAYVAGGTGGVSIIDIAQWHLAGTITVAGNPHTILLSPDGSALYVTQPTSGQVAVIITKTRKTLCTANLPGQPSLLALSLDATVLYVAGQGDTRVRALNPATCTIQRIFETHEPVYGLAVAASTAANATPATPGQLWITGTTSLTVFDVNGQLQGTLSVAGGPQYISIPAGFTAYVTTRRGTLVAVDLNTRRVLQTLLTEGKFGPMDYDAITGEIYVPDQQRNQLDVLLPVTEGSPTKQQGPVRIFRLSSAPQAVAITNDGQFGFVALANGQVAMLDIPKRSLISSITVGGSPYFIITGLYPPAGNSAASLQQAGTTSATSALFSFFIVLMALAVALLLGTLLFLWRYNYRKHLTHKTSNR